MFRIVFFVEDKNLAKALRALTGVALNMEPPQDVTNAVLVKEKKGDKKLKQESTSTSIKGRLIEHLGTMSGSRVTKLELNSMWTDLGGTPGGIRGGLVGEIVKEGALKRIARGQYVVTQPHA